MSSSASFLIVTFVCSRGWTSRIFSHAQFERALPQLEGLDFPLLVSEYHPDDDDAVKATASTAPAHGKRSAGAGAGRAWEVEK